MSTLQIRIDDTLKKQADALFFSSESDMSTTIPAPLQEAIYDSRSQQNLHGPFANAEDAVTSKLEE